MKKLLALVLSLCLVLTMFSGAIGVFADDAASLTPSVYSGSLPQSSANTWGFEDASLLTQTSEHNNVYMIGGAYATPRIENAGITTDEKNGGNSSLYATFNGAGYAHFLIDVEDPAALAAWLTAGAGYHVKADVKTTADFNGGVYFHLIKDGANVGVHDQGWYGEYIFYQTMTNPGIAADNAAKGPINTVLTNWTTVIGKNPGRSPFQTGKVTNWVSGSKLQIRVMITGDAGSIWLDNFDLIDASTTTNKYDGVFTRATQNLTRSGENHNNGGFEENASYYNAGMLPDHHTSYNMSRVNYNEWQHPDFDITQNVGSGKSGAVIVTNKYAHQGTYSLKMYKATATPGGWAVSYPLDYLNAEKDYYLEAYVKLDDFNGSIAAGTANNGPSFINSVYTWFGDNYMLGNNNSNLTKEDVGTGWIHITSQVMDGAKIVESATGTSIKFFIVLKGIGTLYVDDINLIEVNDYTPSVSAANYYGNVNFNSVALTTAGDADIWFTTDGSNPLYSASAMRYDAANPIRIYDNLELKYVGIDKATGATSAVLTQHYDSPADLFKIREASNTGNVVDDKTRVYYNDLVLPADAAEGDIVRLTYEETTSKNDDGSLNYTTKDAVMQFRGYGMKNSVNVSFDVTAAEGFTGESWVKLWLNGGGEFRADMNGDTVNGTFVGKNGYVAKVTQAGTQTVTLKLEGLTAHDAMAPYIERISGSGEVTVDNFKVTIDQVGAPVIDVFEEEAPELDYYIEGYYTDVFPTFTNNSGYALEGKMDIIYADQDGTDVYSKSFDLNLGAGRAYSDWFDISEVIEEYGAYDLQYVFTDVSGRKFVCLEKSIAFLPDNSASTSFRGVNLGVFTQGYDKAYAQLELVKNLGMNYVRTEIRITNEALVTAADGEYVLAESVLEGAQAAADAGIKLIVLLNASASSVDVNDYVQFAADVKAQLADYGIEYYEIINEANGSSATAPKYAQIVKAAYPVLADGNTKVLVGNVSHHGSGFIEAMIAAEADILNYIDIWTVHPYVHNNYSPSATWEDASFHTYLSTLKAEKLDPNGIELWAGEFGYPTADTCQRDNTGLYEFGFDEEYAELSLRQYLGLEAAGYGAAIQYVYAGDNNYWGEQSFGFVAKEDKTAAAATAVYSYLTEGFDFVEQTVVDGVYTNKYENAEGDVRYAVWTTEGEKEVTVSIPAYDYGVADMYGKKAAAAKTPNGDAFDLTLTATTEPTWVVDYVEPYVEPADDTYIENPSVESGAWSGDWVSNMTEGVDTVIKYDGNQSYKLTLNANGSNNRRAIKVKLANVDVNKKYVLRYKYRTSNLQLVSNIYIDGAGINYKNGWYNGEFELNAINWSEPKTTAGWETYESTPFSIASSTGNFVIKPYWRNGGTEAGTIWIDRFELVPVDDTDNHGTVTLSKGDDGAIYATATPAEGYAVKEFTAKGQKGTDNTIYDMKYTFVSENLANRAKTYKIEYVKAEDESVALNVFFKNANFKHFNAIFVPADEMPIDPLSDTIIENASLEEIMNVSIGGGTSALDNTTAVDGETSLRVDIPAAKMGVNQYLYFHLDEEKLATLDVSKNYKLRFYAKTTGGFNAYMGIDAVAMGYTNEAKTEYVELFAYNWMYGSDYPILNPGQIPEKWTVYESQQFPVLGEGFTIPLWFRNGTLSEDVSFWFDRFELVPVEKEDNYSITTEYDEATGKVLATVTADEGYMIDSFLAQGATGYSAPKAAATWELVAQNAVNEVVYAVDFTGVNGFWQGQNFTLFEATTVEVPAADAETVVVGDATGDGEVDILDLVRTKNFELGNTADIDYVNVWHVCADDDNVIDAAQLAALRKIIWALF